MLRRRIGPPPHPVGVDAEAIANDALLAAQREAERADSSSGAMPTYTRVYRIALDTLIEAWRRAHALRRHPGREIPWPEQSSIQLGLGLVQSGTSPSGAVAKKEQAAQIGHVLDSLPTIDREILWLRHYDDLTFGEAGEVLDISENAATARYGRAITRLATLWKKIHGGSRSGNQP